MKYFVPLAFILCACTIRTHAQNVALIIQGEPVSITPEQTQTEIKPGWKIVDYKLPDKPIRYLYGKEAGVESDNSMPTLLITSPEREEESMCNYALIQLKQKKQYRALPSAELKANRYIRLTPEHFDIKLKSTELKQQEESFTFECTPRKELKKGAYILVNLEQKNKGELGDWNVFPFQVP